MVYIGMDGEILCDCLSPKRLPGGHSVAGRAGKPPAPAGTGGPAGRKDSSRKILIAPAMEWLR